jgi:hypothetical protein
MFFNKFTVHRNSNAAIVAIAAVAITYIYIWITAQNPAGGQDSWNHFLYARWAYQNPKLLLDQWGKPFFTLIALPFAPFGLNGVYLLNFMATLGTAWICYLTGRKLAMRNPWLLIFLFGWQPIVFANVHSSLTEPTNALVLIFICYLFVSHKFVTATFFASFLPLVRSEGLILLLSIIPFLLVRGQWKLLPLLFSGTIVFAIFAAIVSGELTYFFYHNPYINHELHGRFDPGSGSLFHYVKAQREITGIVITLLLIISILIVFNYILLRVKKKTPNEMSQFMLWLFLPLFGSFFLAHTFIWYTGTMGSHGLIRVFVVVAPIAAILAQYALDRLMSYNIRRVNQSLKFVLISVMFFLAFSGSKFPYPWKNEPPILEYPGMPQIRGALAFIQKENLSQHILIHQIPELDVDLDILNGHFAKDPSKAKSFYLWSIDKRPGKDWMPDSSVVIWDNFHGRRDAPMSLQEMRNLKQYKELKYFPSHVDTIYDVRVYLKLKQ